MIHLEEANERADSCILDIVENGEVFADVASGDESPGSQDDSRLSRRPIWNKIKIVNVFIFAQLSDLSAISIPHNQPSSKVIITQMTTSPSGSLFLEYFSFCVKFSKILLLVLHCLAEGLNTIKD